MYCIFGQLIIWTYVSENASGLWAFEKLEFWGQTGIKAGLLHTPLPKPLQSFRVGNSPLEWGVDCFVTRPLYINLCCWTRSILHFIIFDNSVLLLHNFRVYLHTGWELYHFFCTPLVVWKRLCGSRLLKRAFLLTTKVGLYRSSADWGAP